MRVTKIRLAAIAAGLGVVALVSTTNNPLGDRHAHAEASQIKCKLTYKLVPSCGALMGSTAPDVGNVVGSFTSLEKQVGRGLDIVHVYHAATDDWPTADEVVLATDGDYGKPAHADGSPNVARWLYANWKPENGKTWRQVANGASDQLIDTLACRLAQRLHGLPLFLTIHHEGENEVQGAGSGYSTSDYVAMFRHVVQRLRADGVQNLVSVWNVIGTAKWGDLGYYTSMYPGDDVVDWIGYDVQSYDTSRLPTYANRTGTGGSTWPGFYTFATRAYPSKPLMLAEFSVQSGNGDDQARANSLRSLGSDAANSFPAIKALVYFDAPPSNTGGRDGTMANPTVVGAAKQALSEAWMRHSWVRGVGPQPTWPWDPGTQYAPGFF
jgi:Glycosyl hydrolase family 26